jgi:diguanylate cyclase (GGDEF)-like protein
MDTPIVPDLVAAFFILSTLVLLAILVYQRHGESKRGISPSTGGARDRVIEWMDDCLMVLDHRNHILDLNPAVRSVLLAIDPAAISQSGQVGQNAFRDLIGEPFDTVFKGWPELVNRLHLGSEGTIELPASPSSFTGKTASAKTFELQILALTDANGHGTGKIILLHDATAPNRTQAELSRANALIDALLTAGPALNAQPEFKQALAIVLEQIGQVFHCDCASLHVLEGSDWVIYAVHGFHHPEILSGTRRLLLENWPSEQILQQHRPMILNNLDADSNPLLHSFAGNIRSCLILPILYHDSLTGMLTLYSYKPGVFSSEAIPTANLFTQPIAAGLEIVRLNQKIDEVASTDSLTGLNNRRHFFSHAEIEVARTLRTGKSFIVLLLDVDHFQQINEIYGRAIGDQVLVALSQICLHSVRKIDLIGRYGGDEFVFILPETDLNGGLTVARRLLHRLSDELITTPSGASLRIAVSMGVAIPLDSEDSLDRIMDRADQALRQAKRAGGNQVRAYERISAG